MSWPAWLTRWFKRRETVIPPPPRAVTITELPDDDLDARIETALRQSRGLVASMEHDDQDLVRRIESNARRGSRAMRGY